MDALRARSELAGSRFADVEWIDETGSTNDDLLDLARRGAGEQVRIAECQTAGRGRLGRRWEAPPGASLLCSVLVRPQLSLDQVHLVPWSLALAAVDAAAACAGVDLWLKWPNDLVVRGRGPDGADAKVAGLLSELVLAPSRVEAVVVGIGLNVNWRGSLPPELVATSASLDDLAGHELDRTAILVAMIRSFEQWLAAAASDASGVHKAVARRSATIGRTVRVELAGGEFTGRAVEVRPSGALVVVGSDGVDVEVTVGDVVHLRAL